jgi:hypothetical protein
VEEVTAKGRKHEHIITLEPEIKRGFILFNPANMAYNNQVDIFYSLLRLF